MKKLALLIALAGVMALAGCSSQETIPSGDARKTLKARMRGYVSVPGVMITKNAGADWIQKAVSGYRPLQGDDLPSSVKSAAIKSGCAMPRSDRTMHVANVHVGNSPVHSPVFAWSKKELKKRTTDFIKKYKRRGDKIKPEGNFGDSMGIVDVVVTETSKPVYLVLQHESSTLFNIHAAQSANIVQIVVIGGTDAAIANAPDGVPFVFLTGKRAANCKAAPRRMPRDYWRFVQNVKGTSNEHILDENIAMHRTYDRWFRRNFSFGSETNLVGIEKAAHVLVGPMPANLEMRVPFRPLAGAAVIAARQDHIFVGTKNDYRKKIGSQIKTLAEKAVGGTLSTIAPKS